MSCLTAFLCFCIFSLLWLNLFFGWSFSTDKRQAEDMGARAIVSWNSNGQSWWGNPDVRDLPRWEQVGTGPCFPSCVPSGHHNHIPIMCNLAHWCCNAINFCFPMTVVWKSSSSLTWYSSQIYLLSLQRISFLKPYVKSLCPVWWTVLS